MKIKNIIFYFIALLFLAACSTSKNTFISRNYHTITAQYNAYFNGNESYKLAIHTIEQLFSDDYQKILPIIKYPYNKEEFAIDEHLNRAIEKGSKVIHLHSINIKGKEYNRMIDDSYMLIGKSNFYNGDYELAIENFDFVSKNYTEVLTKFESLMWLTQCYVQKQEFYKAQEYISLIDNDEAYRQIKTGNKIKDTYINIMKPSPEKKLASRFFAIKTDYFLRQGEYNNAIISLEEAINKERKNTIKKRYTYILAQLYQKIGNYNKAYELFAKVAKKGASYRMEFNAQIQQAMCTDVGFGNTEEVKKVLLELAKDAKNEEFLGQIYFAIASIYQKERDLENALINFKLSAQKAKDNEQKGISYLKVADIYYDIPKYEVAAFFYDSTITFLQEEHIDYQKAKIRQGALSGITYNRQIIVLEDSLQQLSRFTDSELRDYLSQIKLEKEEKELEKIESNQNVADIVSILPNSKSDAWYFYNTKIRKSGYEEFKRKWKNTKQEDNWRRANKRSDVFEEFEPPNFGTKLDEPELTEFDVLVRKIPKTFSQIESSNTKIQLAYYSLMLIYREDLNSNSESIRLATELLNRYQEFKLKPAIYYNLYRIYSEEKNAAIANKYKNAIIEEYPNTEYAHILNNPNYLEKSKELKNQEEQLYNTVYINFINGNYQEVKDAFENIDSIFTFQDYQSKAYYLKALSIQKLEGVKAFEQELENLIERFPDTDVAIEAKETLELLR